MRVDLGQFGIWRHADGLDPALAREIEALGYGTIWIGGSPAGDLRQAEELLDGTERIAVATGIVNMWAISPAELADSYHRVAAKHPDRFVLGVGIGHREYDGAYASPLATMTSYLDGLDEAGVPADRRVLAALAPKALALAAAKTAGAHPYLTTPAHTAWARELLGDEPLIAPEHKVVLGNQPAVAREAIEPYFGMGNYTRNLQRTGYTDEDLKGSDRLINDLVLSGDAVTIAKNLRAHLDAGADHVSIQALPQDETDPLPTYRALAAELIG